MKKIYALLATAMLSLSLFAGPTSIPTASNLVSAGYDPSTNVVLCMYFDVVCNPVILVGNYPGQGKDSPDNWNLTSTKNLKFEALEGFDGWYVVEFNWFNGAYAKPVQLKKDGSASWDFQSGDPAAWVPMDGSALAEIKTENGNESSVNYPAAGAYIYELKYWKAGKSPCEFIPTYNYTIYLIDPYCDGTDFVPAIIGDFSNWANVEMNEATLHGEFVYVYNFTDEADHKIKFRELKDADWSNQLQENVNGGWKDFDDYFLPAVKNGTDTTIIFDYSDTEKYRYAQCGVEWLTVYVIAQLPAGAPAAGVDLMGNFKNGSWSEGLLMTLEDDGSYTATITATESSQVKFREAGDTEWKNQIKQLKNDEWKDADNITLGTDADEWYEGEEEGTYVAEIDLSNPAKYLWATNVPTGIENIVLTEKARKVVVDGAVYIVRDNKLFNIHGAQLR